MRVNWWTRSVEYIFAKKTIYNNVKLNKDILRALIKKIMARILKNNIKKYEDLYMFASIIELFF